MKTLLLVDDEYAIVEVLSLLLADEGFSVLSASDGQQALEMLEEQIPDAVITDQMMPMMGGADLFLAMRRKASLRNVPVILMSSAPLRSPHDKLPWVVFLQKPFDFRELMQVLKNLFARQPEKKKR
jgi:two-component system, OmpR family, alkaline phosphatase synthesis response regulator PhoP